MVGCNPPGMAAGYGSSAPRVLVFFFFSETKPKQPTVAWQQAEDVSQ